MQPNLLEKWANFAPGECQQTSPPHHRVKRFRILTERDSWLVVGENTISHCTENIFFALLYHCKRRGWEVELFTKETLCRAKICELTEHYSCKTAICTTTITEALLMAYVEFLETSDNLDKPELVGNGNSEF